MSSPRLQVFLDDGTAPIPVLAELKKISTSGYAELKAFIASGLPVLDIEMFTNDWYDGGAARVLDLLANWEVSAVGHTLCEASTGTGQTSPITLDKLRNIIAAGEDELARLQERNDHG